MINTFLPPLPRVCCLRCLQKLHIRTVPLGEQPRRIAHQEGSRTFAVTCTQATMGGGEREL